MINFKYENKGRELNAKVSGIIDLKGDWNGSPEIQKKNEERSKSLCGIGLLVLGN